MDENVDKLLADLEWCAITLGVYRHKKDKPLICRNAATLIKLLLAERGAAKMWRSTRIANDPGDWQKVVRELDSAVEAVNAFLATLEPKK